MQCSCQPKFHVRDNEVLTYLFIVIMRVIEMKEVVLTVHAHFMMFYGTSNVSAELWAQNIHNLENIVQWVA